jgi:hypothetical protein
MNKRSFIRTKSSSSFFKNNVVLYIDKFCDIYVGKFSELSTAGTRCGFDIEKNIRMAKKSERSPGKIIPATVDQQICCHNDM